MTTFLVIFIIGGQIENQLLSTGAFEVSLNGIHSCYTFVLYCVHYVKDIE